MKKVFIVIIAIFTICLSSCTKEALAEDDILIEGQLTEGDDGDVNTPPPPPPNP